MRKHVYNFDDLDDTDKKKVEEDALKAEFECPKCGKVSQDDVAFLCNTCNNKDLVYHGGLYMCPSCMNEGQNFQCMLCGSKEVKVSFKF